jgi:uroporphyrinogen-III synthase
LLLRAAHGREWLVERLRATGARVTPLAVYARVAAQWDAPLRQRLQAVLRQGMAPALLVSSSEAIDAVRQQLDAVPGAWDWAQRGCALATHPRIEARLREQGFARVVVCRPDVAAIRAALTGP